MKESVKIYRDKNGIPHIEAENQVDMYRGLGFLHASDRGMQMLLMRVLGRGKLSEYLNSSDQSLITDKFFRKMNWHQNIAEHLNKLTDFAKSVLDAYCEGVNEVFAKKIPLEFKLLGYKPEVWLPEDVIIISRMIGYLTLSQSQDEMERLFVEMVQNDVPEVLLQELFPGILGGLDIDLIKKIILPETIVPSSALWSIAIPRMMASNNWVISGKKTASGKAILANDPHLEVDRLPNVWCEVAAKVKDRYIIGATMPGASAFIIGRTSELAWGATYAFIDSIDSWVEECKDGKYRRGDSWKDFTIRKEIIKRKKKADVEVTFYETEHGVIDGDPTIDGFYLSTKWTASESGFTTINNFLKMFDAHTVEEGMDYVGQLETFWSFVLADNKNNIGFQMSGLVPKRRDGVSGFVPLPGWDKENDWQGMESHKNLPRMLNPEKGFFTTANQDLNEYGNVNPINMPMGSYRADRINNLLSKRDNFSPKDVFEMHYDVYSLQAEIFMKILKPLLPDTKQGKILREWNYEYSLDSKGAFLFEEFYKGICLEVFGKSGMGEGVIDFFANETGVFIDFYQNFDRILLAETSAWFNGKTREEIFASVAEKYLKVKPKKWGETRKVLFEHILFEGKLPRFLGFDKGPHQLKGGRATIHQGQIYRTADRGTTFFPSFRTVTDFAQDETYTNLAGGPSDRRFSKWYTSDLENWLKGKYKTIKPEPEEKIKF
ncbi:MAG: penicillin acylase family protein [Promethearchaeota archaeon]